MRIGMDIGMTKSPDAATFETGPAYEYSFAMDFSKLTADDVNLNGSGTNTNFPYVNQPSRHRQTGSDPLRPDGIRMDTKDGETDDLVHIGFPYLSSATGTDELHIKKHFTSHSQDGIPDGVLSPTYPYLSMVLTFHSQTEDGNASVHYNSLGYFRVFDRDGNEYGWVDFHGDKGGGNDHPRYVNGKSIVDEVTAGTRDAKSGMVKTNPIPASEFDSVQIFTWDFNDAVDTGSRDAMTGPLDVEEITYYSKGLTAAGSFSPVSYTFHGFIFSSTPPAEVTLPIHTSRPVSEFA